MMATCMLAIIVVSLVTLLPLLDAHGFVYKPSYWNQTCKYKAFNITAFSFFAGVGDDGDPMFPLDLSVSRVALAYKHPLQACFGPAEKYNHKLIRLGVKLPCAYQYSKNYNINYWEEQPCPPTLLANCYCYAINGYKAGYCVPGLGSNPKQEPISNWTCADLKRLLVKDGAKPVSWSTALVNKPKGTHYIAAAVGPAAPDQGSDYHIWRLDTNKAWSWKPGNLFVRNTYQNGTLVRDVRDPNIRKLYPNLCGAFEVDARKHKLGAVVGYTGSPIPDRFAQWRAQKFRVSIERLPKWSAGWYGLYSSLYVRRSAGDLTLKQLALLDGTNPSSGYLAFEPGKEPWRSSPIDSSTPSRSPPVRPSCGRPNC